VILDDSIQADWDEYIVSNRGLAPVEAGFKIGADQVPCLVKEIVLQAAKRAGMLPHQGSN
jgi:hypothetical protein